jgi:small subunit ribosomal protein S16
MVKIRLMRRGATKRPFYRVVVADSRSPRDGRFIENIGKYHPLDDPSIIEIDGDRALYWLSHGAQPTEQVENLLKKQGIWEQFEAIKPKKGSPRTAKRAKAAKPAPAPKAEPEPDSGEDDGAEPPEDASTEAEPTPAKRGRRRKAASAE